MFFLFRVNVLMGVVPGAKDPDPAGRRPAFGRRPAAGGGLRVEHGRRGPAVERPGARLPSQSKMLLSMSVGELVG